jgi:crotonobetainyl-CoA:carnitine CoA-transferase CaiB-like acyl-CoA transferase
MSTEINQGAGVNAAAASASGQRAPLEGMRIVDLTQVVVGPLATQILADFGAEVIKIEHPTGDLSRWIGGRSPTTPGMSGKYLHLNRNKKSLALDLKKPGALDSLKKLIATADAVVHNMRPQAAARLGLAPEDLQKLKPDLIYCSVVGFGQEGRYKDKPAYDSIIQGASGLASINDGTDGVPRYVPMVIADRTVGVMLANCLLLAVVQRLRYGGPQVVELPMFESMAAFVLAEHMFLKTFDPPLGGAGDSRLLNPNSRPIKTLDGYICMTANTDPQVHAMFRAIGRPELSVDPRFADKKDRFENIGEMFRIRNEIFTTKTTAEWLAILEAEDLPAMPMHTLDSVLEDPHLADTGLFQKVEHPTEGTLTNLRNPVRFATYTPALRNIAPHIGENSRDVLHEVGYDDDQIDALIAAGAVAQYAPKAKNVAAAEPAKAQA